MRTADHVVAEMKWLKESYGVQEIVIMDDLFNLAPERVNRIAQLLIDQKLDLSVHLCSGLRGDLMTEESIALLRRAGVYRCMYGIDTTSPRLQRLARRNLNIEKTMEAVAISRRHGMMVHATFIVGFPTETEDEARSTVERAMKSELHTAAFHQAIPFPGTELHAMAIAQGVDLPTRKELYDFQAPTAINLSRIPTPVVKKLRRQAYRQFYFDWARMRALWRALPNRRQLILHLGLHWLRATFRL
jgi:radical SAM superfamily enzyme YgiQ (UPF0313 family)